LSPEQFLERLNKSAPAGAYLFIGPEAYQRRICRKALMQKALEGENSEDALSRFDLSEGALAEVLDDARSLSLFASRRVIWVSSAEAALPKGRAASDEDEASGAELLAAYVKHPTPDVVVVFDASQYDFDGEDKTKLERVQKFYAAIRDVVEFRPYSMDAARRLAQDLAKQAGVEIGISELGLLVQALAGDAARIAIEIEKLRLYAGARKVTAEDIAALVPNAQESTIFLLVEALGRGDRKKSLASLDTLIRQGEYLPLALTFLATQFRLALTAQEAGLRSQQQVQSYFTNHGMRMWPQRAQQVMQTVGAFTKQKLAAAVVKVFEADRALRDARPDDRVVMEKLVLSLTN
jgi:DNA polymerase-3 subunit delta